jgi:hypothetical protein
LQDVYIHIRDYFQTVLATAGYLINMYRDSISIQLILQTEECAWKPIHITMVSDMCTYGVKQEVHYYQIVSTPRGLLGHQFQGNWRAIQTFTGHVTLARVRAMLPETLFVPLCSLLLCFECGVWGGLYTPPPNPSGLCSDTWTVLGQS